MTARLKILAVAPYCDGTDVGEAWCAYHWVRHLSDRADVTLLSMQRPGRMDLQTQLPSVRVIHFTEPRWTRLHERLNATAKLGYPAFYRFAVRSIRALLTSGETFDIAHQFSPIALRYPTPLARFDMPYVLGPMGGSLKTPDAFRGECAGDAWYSRLRGLDAWRLAHDPWLKASYRKASAILVVAPYVAQHIKRSAPRSFVVMSELGTKVLPNLRPSDRPGLRILHVGRGVRTKGLRDLVRAAVYLQDIPGLGFDVAGQGPEIDHCRSLAETLGVANRFTFHGQIARSAVDDLYSKADIFCFPSFREPSGSVLIEALSHGLPAIVADAGGPGHVVAPDCGIKVPVTDPVRYARDIADAIRLMVGDPAMRRLMAAGARKKVQDTMLWPRKIDALFGVYADILNPCDKRKDPICPNTQTGNRPKKSLPLPPVAATGSSC